MADLAPDTLLRRAEPIMHTDLGEKTVMMDLEKGNYYGLNRVGARIWALLEQPASVRSLCDRLLAEYEVEPDECERTVTAFVRDLLDRGVLVRAGG